MALGIYKLLILRGLIGLAQHTHSRALLEVSRYERLGLVNPKAHHENSTKTVMRVSWESFASLSTWVCRPVTSRTASWQRARNDNADNGHYTSRRRMITILPSHTVYSTTWAMEILRSWTVLLVVLCHNLNNKVHNHDHRALLLTDSHRRQQQHQQQTTMTTTTTKVFNERGAVGAVLHSALSRLYVNTTAPSRCGVV